MHSISILGTNRSKLEWSLHFSCELFDFRVSKITHLEGEYVERVFNRKGVKLTYAKLLAPGQRENDEPLFELHWWQRPRIVPTGGFHHLSLTVRDMRREYARLLKRGVSFIARPVRAPHGKTRVCFARDPDGNLIEFIEDVR